jgi:hypothetical protein
MFEWPSLNDTDAAAILFYKRFLSLLTPKWRLINCNMLETGKYGAGIGHFMQCHVRKKLYKLVE